MNTRKAFTLSVLALLFLAFFTGLSPLGFPPVAKALTPVNLNDLMAEKYAAFDALVSRYSSLNGTLSEYFDYSNGGTQATLSGVGGYFIALRSFYDETGDEYYLRKMQYFLDQFIDDSFFYTSTVHGTIHYIPQYYFGGGENDITPKLTADAGIMALDVYELTGEAKYKILADEIAEQFLLFAVINNATDFAIPNPYYAGPFTEAQCKIGVNRLGAVAWFFARYADYNATYASYVPKIAHWIWRAKVANNGLGYSIGDVAESTAYTDYALFFVMKAYALQPSTFSAAMVADMNSTVTRVLSYTKGQGYLESMIEATSMIAAIEAGLVPASGNYSKFAQTHLYVGLKGLQFGEQGIQGTPYDATNGYRWSQFFVGAMFANYPLPDSLAEMDDFDSIVFDWEESATAGRYYLRNAPLFSDQDVLFYLADAYNQIGTGMYPYAIYPVQAGVGTATRSLDATGDIGVVNIQFSTNPTNVDWYVYPDWSAHSIVTGSGTAYFYSPELTYGSIIVENGTSYDPNTLSNGTLALSNKFLAWREGPTAANHQSIMVSLNTTDTWTFYRYPTYYQLFAATSNYELTYAYSNHLANSSYAFSLLSDHVDAIATPEPLTFDDIVAEWLNMIEASNPTPSWLTVYENSVSTTPKLIGHDYPGTTYLSAWSYTSQTRTLTFTVHNEVAVNSTFKLYLGPISPETTYNVTDEEFDNTLGIDTLIVTHTSEDMVVTLIFQPLATVSFMSSPEVEGYFTVSGSANYITPETLYLEIDTAYVLNCTSPVKGFGDLNYYFQSWRPTGGTYEAVYPTFYSMTLTPKSAAVTVEMVFGLSPPSVPPGEEPIIGEGDVELDYYFHAGVQTVNDVSGYSMLTTTPTEAENVGVDTAGTATISWGWRVYLQYEGSAYEMTGGSPEAVVDQLYGDGNQSALLSADLTLDQTRLYFGKVALKFNLYSRWNETGDWTVQAVFITDYLFYPELEANTVTVNIYGVRTESGGSTYASSYWGTTTYISGVEGVLFKAARSTDWQSYYLDSGNFLSFLTIPYTIMIGNAIYALALFGVGMSLYIRYRQASILVLFIVLLGGAGGVIQLLIGDLFMGAIWIVAAFGLGLIYWRLFR